MIPARHNRWVARTIDVLVGLLFRLAFRKMEIRGSPGSDNRPVLLVANHFSWWDGYVARAVTRKVLRRRFHVMMLEEELIKRPFLTRLGAFSIRKNSRKGLRSINYAATLLADPANMVLVYPQGQFQSQHRYPLRFERGWTRILEQVREPVRIVFLAGLIDYFNKMRPVLTVYLTEYVPPAGTRNGSPNLAGSESACPGIATTIERDYNTFYRKSVAIQEDSAVEDGRQPTP